ncbi:BOI-related E3 ubiquitin-protein ligase 1-like isoform X1 [Zingiber officinale]|uniref:RING-type domain-containing protein n=1 Tax=Zingiber officinale TaxID=94328 RepID=A0A8J5GWF2_ZINOF|nr:BOI-related E3 ubiquitin-protein ligase 1-like isoform X1 [Zingiber officinale]KAG6515395.1 hypothetical protein ZIOFF_025807 [Zingiber officinale]
MMAAQAVGFSSGSGDRSDRVVGVFRGMEGVQMLQQEPLQVSSDHGIGKQQMQPHIRINPSVFSERKRGLTCNVSAPAKRARAEFVALNGYNQIAASPLFPYLDQAAAPVKLAGTIPGFLLQNRPPESGATSTSGRHDSPLQPVLSSSGDLVSLIYKQNLEIDAFICLQNERMLNEFKEMRNRHCRAVLSLLGKQMAKRLMEKEAELQSVTRRNAELEEKVWRMSEENKIWYNVAKNNEAVASNLQSSLEQALLRGGVSHRDAFEVAANSVPDADVAESCCEAENSVAAAQRGTACRACCEKDVSVLLLPCRHLCLCEDCDAVAGGCPVCGATKKTSFHVLLC